MKAKFQVGSEIEFLTKDELGEELKTALGAWRTEIGRGVRWRKFSGQGTVAGGAWVIGGTGANNDKDPLGPQPGFVWAVTRIAVSGNGFVPGTDAFSVYVGEAVPSRLVITGLTRGETWDVAVLVLNGGEELALTGVGTGLAGTDVTVSGQAVELPSQLAWQLL